MYDPFANIRMVSGVNAIMQTSIPPLFTQSDLQYLVLTCADRRGVETGRPEEI